MLFRLKTVTFVLRKAQLLILQSLKKSVNLRKSVSYTCFRWKRCWELVKQLLIQAASDE